MLMKSREELFEEIDLKNEEIKDLKNQVERLERYKQYDEMADEIKAIHDSFVRSGFSEKEAFSLTKAALGAAAGMTARLR